MPHLELRGLQTPETSSPDIVTAKTATPKEVNIGDPTILQRLQPTVFRASSRLLQTDFESFMAYNEKRFKPWFVCVNLNHNLVL